MEKKIFILVVGLSLLASFAFAETRGLPYTLEQLFERSTLVFEGTIVEIETVAKYNDSFPVKTTVNKVVKGKFGSDEITLGHKHPARSAIFEAGYNIPLKGQQGTFYVKTEWDNNYTLIGYIVKDKLTPKQRERE